MLLNSTIHRMLTLTYSLPFVTKPLGSLKFSRSVVVCAAKGPRPRYPRVWKTRKKIGSISKSAKLVECIKGLSNIKEEVYGALDSFIAWDLEFPLIVVKKALKTLEYEKEWKRIIQVTKWMLSKGQGTTLGSYLTLLNALAEDGRIDEAEELWTKLFTENMDCTPRYIFEKMASIYYKRGMHEKLLELFADMDELGVRPTVPIVAMVGNVFKELGMMDKYAKLMRKYPPPKWEFQYIKGKRIRVPAKHLSEYSDANKGLLAENATKGSSSDVNEFDTASEGVNEIEVTNENSSELYEEASEDQINNENPGELCEEATEDELTNENSDEQYEGAETRSIKLNSEANVSS